MKHNSIPLFILCCLLMTSCVSAKTTSYNQSEQTKREAATFEASLTTKETALREKVTTLPVQVVVIETVNLSEDELSWLPGQVQDRLTDNLQEYLGINTVVDAKSEAALKKLQAESEDFGRDEDTAIELGKITTAQYAIFTKIRKTASGYTVAVDFTDLTTGAQVASAVSSESKKADGLYAAAGAVDELTIGLADKLNIFISSASREILTTPVVADRNAIPDWLIDYQKAFPKEEYIAQIGSGASEAYARNEAASLIASYFKSRIDSKVSSERTMSEVNGQVQKASSSTEKVNITSQVELFGLEYTEPYFVAAENKWYSVAYIHRETAWNQFQPEINLTLNIFNGHYSSYSSEQDPITRMGMYGTVQAAGDELLEKLEYGRIISAEREEPYEVYRDHVAEVPVLYEAARQKLSVYVKVTGDYNKTINTALSTAFGEAGLKVAKYPKDAEYTAEVTVDNNAEGSDPMEIRPSVSVKLVNRQGKTVFSLDIVSETKGLGYKLESAQKKVFPQLAEQVEQETVWGLYELLEY